MTNTWIPIFFLPGTIVSVSNAAITLLIWIPKTHIKVESPSDFPVDFYWLPKPLEEKGLGGDEWRAGVTIIFSSHYPPDYPAKEDFKYTS